MRAWCKTFIVLCLQIHVYRNYIRNEFTECIDCFITEEHHQDLGQGHMKDVGVAPPEGMNLCSCGWILVGGVDLCKIGV